MDEQIKEKIILLLEKKLKSKSFSESDKSEWIRKVSLITELKNEWEIIKSEIDFCKEVLNSSQLRETEDELFLAKKEIENLEKKKVSILEKTETLLTSEEDNLKGSCVVEIRSGAGGDEAKLFTRTIFQMYLKFCEKKKWKVETMNSKTDQLGGFSFVSFLIKGKDSFNLLKNESGVHRVQRIPETENKGRVQTSTVSVVVFPELDDINVKIESKDIRIDTYKSSGAGGQHVNTTDSAVRITHIPTGIFTTSQDGRSQIENRKYAMLTLRSLIYEMYKKNQSSKVDLIRNSAIGSSERSEKIRTYNFQQSRVTDHRISFQTNKLESFIDGEIDELCKKLIESEEKFSNNKLIKIKKIESFIEKIGKNENF